MTKICYKNANPICEGIESGVKIAVSVLLDFRLNVYFSHKQHKGKKGKAKDNSGKNGIKSESESESVENMQIAVGS